MTALSYDVIVVGGGPVGAAAAIALKQQGFNTALVERTGAP
ncbi:MAG TPA: FAD-dependent oxidoreductase, partial [Nevskia sp.]|nr:FAD-dependent oxidoreductase [Nevskia sp.]